MVYWSCRPKAGRQKKRKRQERQKMKLPIDTSSITFIAASAPEAVLDYDTKTPKLDNESGQPLHSLQVVALSGDGADVLSVKVPGEPKGVAQGSTLKLVGLTAQPWVMGERSGVSFRAGHIETAGPSRSAA
jgi:hypothetical protein